jgi:hypothetical protein
MSRNTIGHRPRRVVSPLAAGALVGLLALTAAAQSKPGFAGRWTVEPAPPAGPAGAAPGTAAPPPRGDPGSGWGSTIVITQDAARLSVETVMYSRYDLQPQPVLTYALDGSESKNTLMLGRGMQAQTSRARWDGDRLRITTVRPQQMEVTQTLTLESPDRLVVEAAWGAALGGQSSLTRTVYRRN